MNFNQAVENIREELVEIRKEIHAHPETGHKEYETSRLICEVLTRHGIPYKRFLETAVVAEVSGGKPGKTVGFRADMDALPVSEETGVSFASTRPGFMHACGHDVHTTAALGAAILLSEVKEELAGTVKFFFQPDEEMSGGAAPMIEAGCMGDTEAVFGCHVDPYLPEGVIGVRYGAFYAANDIVNVRVHGTACHGATPEKGVSALYAAAEIMLELKDLPAKVLGDETVLSICRLDSGTACNIVSAEAELEGILRTFGSEKREKMKAAIKATVDRICEKYGATADLWYSAMTSGITNVDSCSAHVEKTARRVLGDAEVRVIDHPLMISEDFGEFISASSGAFYHVGAGCSLPLHHSAFLPTEKALVRATAVHAAVLYDYLNKQ